MLPPQQRGSWHGQGQKGLSSLPGEVSAVSVSPLCSRMSPQLIPVSRDSAVPAGPQPGPLTFALRLSSSASAPLSSSDTSGASSPGPSRVSSSRPIFLPFSKILCFSSCGVGDREALWATQRFHGHVPWDPALLQASTTSSLQHSGGDGIGGFCPALILQGMGRQPWGEPWHLCEHEDTHPQGPQMLQ